MQLKKTRKIYIPIKKYPEYNFIGLIIGPRGITQKNMEKETGAKIAIRGRGSVKDGRTKQDKKWDFGEDDELHVLITADREDQVRCLSCYCFGISLFGGGGGGGVVVVVVCFVVLLAFSLTLIPSLQLEAATKAVERLLVPVDEEKNEHKKNQLRQLAVFNGTLRDHNWAVQQGKFNTGMEVACKICGEVSHPTSDCPLKNQPGVKSKIDKEYENFMAEIGEAPKKEPGDASGATGADAAYEEFMASLGGAPPPPPPSAQPATPAASNGAAAQIGRAHV